MSRCLQHRLNRCSTRLQGLEAKVQEGCNTLARGTPSTSRGLDVSIKDALAAIRQELVNLVRELLVGKFACA